MLFQSIEEPPGPDEFRRQEAESDENSEPTRSRCDNHHNSDAEERKAKNNSKIPLGLLDSLYQHLTLTHLVRCA